MAEEQNCVTYDNLKNPEEEIQRVERMVAIFHEQENIGEPDLIKLLSPHSV